MRFFCTIQHQERTKVKDAVFVQFLTDIQVFKSIMEGRRMLLLHIRGYSERERPGIPSLVFSGNEKGDISGLLEFDFVIHPLANAQTEEYLEWEINEVLMLDDAQQDMKAIKVKAGNNADIALVKDR